MPDVFLQSYQKFGKINFGTAKYTRVLKTNIIFAGKIITISEHSKILHQKKNTDLDKLNSVQLGYCGLVLGLSQLLILP